jgi:hypothetical protein
LTAHGFSVAGRKLIEIICQRFKPVLRVALQLSTNGSNLDGQLANWAVSSLKCDTGSMRLPELTEDFVW